jgi:hypothetical protein
LLSVSCLRRYKLIQLSLVDWHVVLFSENYPPSNVIGARILQIGRNSSSIV